MASNVAGRTKKVKLTLKQKKLWQLGLKGDRPYLFLYLFLVEFNKRVTAVIELFKTCLPVKKSSVHHLQSFASFMKNRNLIVNELNIFKGAVTCT